MAMGPMLTLDPTTLFYFSLRGLDAKDEHAGLIKNWTTKIPRNAKPRSTCKATPSLSSTHGSTHSSHVPPSTRSALATVKTSRHGDGIQGFDRGLSDCDETKDAERDAAFNSAPKGKVRLTSSVSHHLLCGLLSYNLCHVTAPGEDRIPTKVHNPTNQMAPKAYKQQAA
jgi:hypothetical protein